MEGTENTTDTRESQPAVSGTPFFKIPGGKRKLVETLFNYFPADFFDSPNSQFVEPFLGAGAMSLAVAARLSQNGVEQEEIASRLFLNDGNPHIANLWNMVTETPEELIQSFSKLIDNHNDDAFYNVRGLLETSQIGSYDFTDPLETAAEFLYLNKNCYNGLIRYNKSGAFNSPLGRYDKPQSVDFDNLRNISKMGLQVSCKDFVSYLEKLMEGQDLSENTLIYFDPPYVPLNVTSSFTDYTASGFNEDDQLRLRGMVDRLTRMGVKVILSNSNAAWVRREYKDYHIHTVRAKRAINSVGSRRGKVKEVVITNFII